MCGVLVLRPIRGPILKLENNLERLDIDYSKDLHIKGAEGPSNSQH